MTSEREHDYRHRAGAAAADPIEGIRAATAEADSALRRRDRTLGSRIVTGRAYLATIVLLVLLLAALMLPHSSGVRGVDVLFHTHAATSQETSLPSYVFVTLYAVGTLVFGTAMLVLRTWRSAAVAWCATCVAAVYGLLAIWLRQSGRGADPDFTGFGGPGVGMYLSEILVVALAVSTGLVLWSRPPEQRRLEREVRGEID